MHTHKQNVAGIIPLSPGIACTKLGELVLGNPVGDASTYNVGLHMNHMNSRQITFECIELTISSMVVISWLV